MWIFTLQAGHPILTEGRKDPITRRALQAGDQVVACAHCRCLFLVDSWQLVNQNPGLHGGVENTLRELPARGVGTVVRPSHRKKFQVESTRRPASPSPPPVHIPASRPTPSPASTSSDGCLVWFAILGALSWILAN